MQDFISGAKKKYKEQLVPFGKEWPPCHSNKFISLELIEGGKTRYVSSLERGQCSPTLLHHKDIFNVQGKKIRKVLLEGDAGVGKTTLCTKLSVDWANDEIFHEFELLLLLPLRHRKISSATSFIDVLKLLNSNTKVCQACETYIADNEGDHVLIIADGWDELDGMQREEGSFLYDLLFEKFPFLSLLLTSRPSAASSLHRVPCIKRYIEIRGFNEKQSEEYILAEFESDHEKGKRLIMEMKTKLFQCGMCSIPLNCSVICHLWRTREESLPATMTELYTKTILNVVLHSMQKVEKYKHVRSLQKFHDLPESLIPAWLLLCEFAYRSLDKNQIVFSREELEKVSPAYMALEEKVLCFGLLQTPESVIETGYGMAFNYLHKTFQEYLAALYLANQPLDKVIEIMTTDSSTKQSFPDWASLKRMFMMAFSRQSRFSPVWKFFFGLCEFDPSKLCKVQHLIRFISTSFQPDRGITQFCHIAYEARNKLITSEVMHALEQISESNESLGLMPALYFGFPYMNTLYDFDTMLYVILESQKPLTLILNFGNSCFIGDDQITRLTQVLAKNERLQVHTLILNGNNLTDESFSNLFIRASAAFQVLQKLYVSGNRIGAESLNAMVSVARCEILTELDLSHNFLGESGQQALQNAVLTGSLVLLRNINLRASLTNDIDKNGILLNVLSCCINLSTINVSQNNLSVPGASAIGRILSNAQLYLTSIYPHSHILQLFDLNLTETQLGDEGLFAFVKHLHCQIHFSHLELKGNGIQAGGISCLADAIHSSTIVVLVPPFQQGSLHLGDNPVGIEGAKVIGNILSTNLHHLTNLDLSRCQLTTKVTRDETVMGIAKQLCQMPQSNILVDLNLDGNSFTGVGIHVLVGFMCLCPSLSFLQTCQCEITSDDIFQLMTQLETHRKLATQKATSKCDVILCSKLNEWSLSNNQIDDRGLIKLIDQLPSLFPRLGFCYGNTLKLHIDGNPVSCENTKKLDDAMHRRRKV